MADTDKKGGVLHGFPKSAWQAGFSRVWSKEKISGSDFKIRATNFKIQGTNFSGCLSGVFLKRTKNAAFRCSVLIACPGLEKPRDFDPFGQTGWSPLATI